MRNLLVRLVLACWALSGTLPAAADSPAFASGDERTPVVDALTWRQLDRLPTGNPPPPVAGITPEERRQPEFPMLPDDPLVPFGVTIEQVVVTSDALAASFARYAADETRRGVPTVVRTTSWIDARYRGPDSSARIRTFLREARDRWGTKFAVLGGDVEHVPTRYVPWGADEIPSDLYFECLDREWNEDGDAIFGEPLSAAFYDGYLNDVSIAPDGRAWVASYFGVAVLDGGRFHGWDVADGLPADEVLCVSVGQDGSVWAGTVNGVAHWNGTSWQSWGLGSGLPEARVVCIDAANDEDVWIGTNAGLGHWDGSEWEVFRESDGLPNAAITCLARDGAALWVGTPTGAARLSGGAFEVFTLGSGILSNWVQAVARDTEGRIWFGHADNWFAQGGISVFDTGVWSTDAFPALGGLSVRNFTFDGDVTWAATGRGLLRRGTGGDEWFDETAGLGRDVYDVAYSAGALSIATSAGLVQGNPGSWAQYGVDDGLPRAPRVYDDIDWTSDVLVGRIPATDAAEVNIYLDKLEAYRLGVGADHADRVLALGEDLFSPGDGRTFAEDALAKMPPSYQRTRLYEIEGTQNRASVLAALNEGPGWVVSVSHGSYDVLGAGPGAELLFNRDIDATSSGGRPAFVLVCSCNSGGFDFESTAEHMLFHPSGGAIAMVSNVREAVPGVDASINERFLEALFASEHGRPVEALRDVRTEELERDDEALRIESWWRRTHLTRSYLGAPTLALWRTPPRTLHVTHPPTASLVRGPFEVVVTDLLTGDPVRHAQVCVSKGREDWARGATNAEGRVTLEFDPESPGAIDVVVDAVDFCLWSGTATATPAAGPDLEGEGVETLALDSTASGREMEFRLGLRNAGSASAGAWTVQLESQETAMRVVQGSATLPALAAGQLGWSGPFRVQTHASVPDGGTFGVRLVGAGATSFVETFHVVFRRPSLRIVAVRLDGDTIHPIFENTGSTSTGALRTTLRSVDGSVVVVSGLANDSALAPGERREFQDTDLRAIGPAEGMLELVVSDDRGGSAVLLFDRVAPGDVPSVRAEPCDVGARLEWDASDAADLLGYRVLRKDGGSSWVDALNGELAPGAFAELAVPAGESQEFAIVAVDRAGLESLNRALIIANGPPRALPGWPRQLSSSVGPSPVVAQDIDDDGQLEVLLGSMWDANAVHLFRPNGAEWSDGDANPATAGVFGVTAGRLHSAPLAHDIDGDGRAEIFAVSFDGYAYGWRADDAAGAVPLPGWPVFLAVQGARSGPVAADVDGDGDAEVVTFALDGVVRAHRSNGTMAPGWPKATHAFGAGSTPAVVDLNLDGKADLVFGGADSLLYAVSGTGADLPGFPIAVGSKLLSSPVLADVDDDGDPEIFVMARDGRVHAFHHEDRNGAPGADAVAGWPVALEPYEYSPPSPAVADLDGDGIPEIVVPARTSLAILRADGTNFAGWPRDFGTDVINSPIIADLDGDGALDVVIGTYDRRLRGLRQNGSSLPGWPRVLHERPWSTPCVADVDANGFLDVVLGSDDLWVRVEATTSPDVAGATPWPGYHGGPTLTGVYAGSAALPAAVDSPSSTAGEPLRLLGAAPNPFGRETWIRFALPAAGPARVAIYDLAGRRVATPVDQVLAAGRHTVGWNGRNDDGLPVSSGVYFVELLAPSGRRTDRILRVR